MATDAPGRLRSRRGDGEEADLSERAALAGRTVLVAGGTGTVGEGIVAELLASGARVVVPSRSATRLDTLRDRVGSAGDLVPIAGDVGHPTGVRAVRDRIQRDAGSLDAVVASVGGWWSGRSIVDLPVETWQRLVDERITPHVVIARTFLPMIADQPGASYTIINGSAGLEPVAGAGPQCVASGGLLMLADVLAAEHEHRPVRINSLVLMAPVVGRGQPDDRDGRLTAGTVGRCTAHLVSDASDVRGARIRLAAGGQVQEAAR